MTAKQWLCRFLEGQVAVVSSNFKQFFERQIGKSRSAGHTQNVQKFEKINSLNFGNSLEKSSKIQNLRNKNLMLDEMTPGKYISINHVFGIWKLVLFCFSYFFLNFERIFYSFHIALSPPYLVHYLVSQRVVPSSKILLEIKLYF